MKWLSVLFALPVLAACDGDKLPSQPEPPAKPEVKSTVGNPEPAATLEPAPTLGPDASEEGAPPNIEIEIEPVTTGDSEELPSERIVSETPPKPVARAPAKKEVAVERVELPEPELDLSLPEDWTEELEPEQDTASMQLLPPMFESSKGSRSVQMSGRLLPGLEPDETSIDGAQINFELKR
jgi:hypothetical protein